MNLIELPFRILNDLYIPQVLMAFNSILKPNTRPLSARERDLAFSIFGNQVRYDLVQIDDRAYLGCKHYHFAYVGFNVINCWGSLRGPHFIHEMVHVWQFQRFGSVYIPRALKAQHSAAGYNYGGAPAVIKAATQGQSLLDFNYEQQADLVSDYFCLLNGYHPRWCRLDLGLVPFFERVIAQRLIYQKQY